MQSLEIIGFFIAIVPLLGAFYSYVHSENLKARERKIALLNEYRDKIQMNPSIASIMYLCERDMLAPDFYHPEVDSNSANTCMNVVATLGFFDAMCYSFFTKNLGIIEFVYFWGEMTEIMKNKSILAYLDFLERRNYDFEKETIEKSNDLIDLIFPYCYLQIFYRVLISEMNRSSRRKLLKSYWSMTEVIEKELQTRFQQCEKSV